MTPKKVSVQEGNVTPPSRASTSVRHAFFIKRLKELGLYDADSDYDGMIGEAVEELSKTFANQGHSGSSAAITMSVFNQLMYEYQTPSLKELTEFAKDKGLESPEEKKL